VPDTVTAAANATHVNIPVKIIDDSEFGTLQSVTLILTDTDDYDLGRAPWHTLFIDDDEAELVTRLPPRDMPTSLSSVRKGTFEGSKAAA